MAMSETCLYHQVVFRLVCHCLKHLTTIILILQRYYNERYVFYKSSHINKSLIKINYVTCKAHNYKPNLETSHHYIGQTLDPVPHSTFIHIVLTAPQRTKTKSLNEY